MLRCSSSFRLRRLVTIAHSSADGVKRDFPAPFALRSLGGLINGKRVFAADGRTSGVFNPADETCIAHVADLGAAETHAAIAGAVDASKSWAGTLPAARARILRDWGGLLRTHSRGLGALLSAEAGKPLAEAIGEIAYAAGEGTRSESFLVRALPVTRPPCPRPPTPLPSLPPSMHTQNETRARDSMSHQIFLSGFLRSAGGRSVPCSPHRCLVGARRRSAAPWACAQL